jgi:glycosyltransferase involved in cell wall biosynthesis
MTTRGAVIGIDARAADPVPTGLTTYARELVRAMIAIGREHSFVVIRRPDSGPPFAEGPNVRELLKSGDASTPTLAGRISGLGLDLYHSVHHFLPIGLRAPRIVVTLHDLIWLEHPELIRSGRLAFATRPITHLYARAAMTRAVARADRVIAISAYTAERAQAYFGLARERVEVIHHGVAHENFRPDAPIRLKASLDCARDGPELVEGPDPPAGDTAPAATRYFLCVGNSKPYKNLATAVRAFAICAADLPDVKLLVAGRGDGEAELTRLAGELGVLERIRFCGNANVPALVELLHGAIALIFPSLVEGFGLPVLEAMAAGCPVVASNCPPVAEVSGSGALLCDPRSPAAFAAAMTRVASDASAADDLRRRGIARAAPFTWTRCAEQTLAVYERLLSARMNMAARSELGNRVIG